MVMPPYQMADASAIGTKVRAGLNPTRPANGGTTAREAGKKPADKDAGHAEPEVLPLDHGE